MNKWSLFCLMIIQGIGSTYSQSLSSGQHQYLDKQIKIIAKDTVLENARWEPVASQLKNKNMIFLGEQNHGSKELFRWRNDLIQYLHQKHGFNTVLFESGIGELLNADGNESTLSSIQMTRRLFGGWRTAEFRDLMAYINSEQMGWAGFDVQRSGGSFKNSLDMICKKNHIDSVFYSELESRYSQIQSQLNNRKSVYDSLQSTTFKLIHDYHALYSRMGELNDQALTHQFLFVRQTLKNRMVYLNYMLSFLNDHDFHKRWASRDSMMAENLIWLKDHIYPGQKIIIIAHNFHVSRWNEMESSMGEIIHSRYPQQTYVLGLFSREGSYADNSGNPVSMTAPDSTRLDIKHLIGAMKGYAGFMDLKNKTIPRWLYDPVVVNDSFIDLNGSNQLILPKHFDGLLMLQKVSPASSLE